MASIGIFWRWRNAMVAKAIVLTADATVGGNRETDRRNGFTFPLAMPIVQAYQSGIGQTMDAVYGFLQTKTESSRCGVQLRRNLTYRFYVKGSIRRRCSTCVRCWSTRDLGLKSWWPQLDGGPAAFDSLQIVADARRWQSSDRL